MSDVEETPADVGEVEQVEETEAAPAKTGAMSIEEALQEVRLRREESMIGT
jgi:hypothetical protein